MTNHQLEILRTPHRSCILATRFNYLAGANMHAWFWNFLQIGHWIETRDSFLLVVFDVHGCCWNVCRCMMNPRRSDSATIHLDGWIWCVVTNHQLEILRTPHRSCILATRFQTCTPDFEISCKLDIGLKLETPFCLLCLMYTDAAEMLVGAWWTRGGQTVPPSI